MRSLICLVVEETKSFDWERSEVVLATTNDHTANRVAAELTKRIDHDAEERCDYKKEYRVVTDVTFIDYMSAINIEDFCD